MKYEFELDAEDDMLFYSLFQSFRLHMCNRLLEADGNPDLHYRIPYDADHIHLIYDIEDKIYNRKTERMDLKYYYDKYGQAEYSKD